MLRDMEEQKRKCRFNFYETSFGSLKESIYIFFFATELACISAEEYQQLFSRKEEIAKMLWKTLDGLRDDSQEWHVLYVT